jgi:hypothetical protein
MPVHHLLEQILNEYISCRGSSKRATAVSERKFGWNEGDGTCFEPLQRLGCDPKAGQNGGLSHPRRMSHLASNRHYNLPGKRRPAGARPADGWP